MVDDEVVKKTVYDKLVAKVNDIDTSRFVLKTKYDTDNSNLEQKTDTSGLVKKTDDNTTISEIVGKIPNVSGLATIVTLTAIENKIVDAINIIKKNRL